MLGINTIREILAPSTDMQPVQSISFKAGDCEVHGAEVTETAWFCDTWNFKVRYTFTGYDGREHVMTQWIAQGELI